MKPPQSRSRLRIQAALFALLLAAVTPQVGGAAAIPLPGEYELLAWLASVLRAPPVWGSWALLAAGISGVWAIGHRRMSAPGGGSLDPYGLRRP